jgi:hypothetical protein
LIESISSFQTNTQHELNNLKGRLGYLEETVGKMQGGFQSFQQPHYQQYPPYQPPYQQPYMPVNPYNPTPFHQPYLQSPDTRQQPVYYQSFTHPRTETGNEISGTKDSNSQRYDY